MATFLCPNQHQSSTSDYCDVCGEPIGAPATLSGSGSGAVPPASSFPTRPAPSTLPPGLAAPTVCPHCQASNPGDALFCEVCGYDFTTGQAPPAEPIAVMPTVEPTALSDWGVEVTADREWYDSQKNSDSDPFPANPTVRVVVLPARVALIGRASVSRNIHPDIDAADDSAVSRRHAQLVHDTTGWSVVDLQSTNGTHVAKRGEAVQADALHGGVPTALADGDSVLVGVWTRITLRSPDHTSGPPPTTISSSGPAPSNVTTPPSAATPAAAVGSAPGAGSASAAGSAPPPVNPPAGAS